MVGYEWSESRRRTAPRVPVESFCTEMHEETSCHGIVTDISPDGLCIQRPLGLRHKRVIPIEFELPEMDEIMWALGEVRFDEVKRAPTNSPMGLGGMVRQTGFRVVSAAERHRKLLREYVMDTWFTEHAPISSNWLMNASCFRA